MAYEMVMPYHLHMPSYFLETFTEYPKLKVIMKNHCCINTIPHRHNNSHNSYTNTKGIPTESFIGNTVYLAMNNNYMSRMDRIGKKSY